MSLTKEDIVRIVEEEDVKFIRMQFVDVLGQMKNVAITVSQLDRALDGEISIDGSSIEGFIQHQRVRPVSATRSGHLLSSIPWRPQQGKVARLICDVYNPDGTPFVGDPRGGAEAGG